MGWTPKVQPHSTNTRYRGIIMEVRYYEQQMEAEDMFRDQGEKAGKFLTSLVSTYNRTAHAILCGDIQDEHRLGMERDAHNGAIVYLTRGIEHMLAGAGFSEDAIECLSGPIEQVLRRGTMKALGAQSHKPIVISYPITIPADADEPPF